MNQELVTINNNQAVASPQQQEDLSGLGSIGAKIGNLQLIQGTTRDPKGGSPGQFLDTFDESIYSEITVIPLRNSVGRVFYPDKKNFGVAPTCRSSNGIVPSPKIESPQSARCATCKMSKWIGKTPPPCNDTRRMLVIKKETGLPAFINVHGISIKPYEAGFNKMKTDILKSRNAGLALDLYDYFFTLRSEKKPGSQVYYLYFDNIKRVLEPGMYKGYFDEFVVSRFSQEAEQEQFEQAEGSVEAAVSGVIDAEFVDQPLQAA